MAPIHADKYTGYNLGNRGSCPQFGFEECRELCAAPLAGGKGKLAVLGLLRPLTWPTMGTL